MVQKLKLVVASAFFVTLWVSPEKSALTGPPEVEAPPPIEVADFTLPNGSWEKLRSLFSPSDVQKPTMASRKGTL